ncbi:MAG: hypothetical protein ACPLKQ_08800 [Candidatus Bathyarchaeales archaeon]
MNAKTKIGSAKISALVMTLLILAYTTALCMAAGGGSSSSGNRPEVPGVPENALQYNKTNITPVAEMEQVRAGEPTLFRYRNMTMLMNCTRNCTVIFTADPEVTPKVLWISVDPNRTMNLTINMYRSPLQGEQVMERTLNFYMGIEPNAEVQLRAQIRLHINQTQLRQELNREVNVSRLTWMYWNRTRAQWEPVESYMDQNGYLVCNTTHFSLWTVAEIADTTISPADASEGGIPAEYIYIGIIAIAVIVVAVGTFAYKRRK